MITFCVSVILLLGGYFIYGRFAEKVFNIMPDRPTPAMANSDGVDFVPMSWPKIFLIQLLNIAGLGPIFGALAGALWGPVVFLWIVFGCIFAGAVHDFISGMMSLRHNGESISEIIGIYLGKHIKRIMLVFIVALLILVGAVFISGPAKLMAALTPKSLDAQFWAVYILIYYFIATIFPIDKIIGRIYPIFGIALVIMAVGIAGGIILKGYHIPELQFANLHPKGLPIWPLMFITVACGAISGFHSTQSPMMARCLKNEIFGRKAFYGAMIAEGLIALIWAAAGMAFFGSTAELGKELAANTAGGAVHKISISLLGGFGGILAILGVIACPITTGDTAFRSARLTISDAFKINQCPILKRLLIAAPLFIAGYGLTFIRFDIIWRYFAWANQTLAMVILWTAAVYLRKNGRFYWIAAIPAAFMTTVSCTYILIAPEGFALPANISYFGGIAAAVVAFSVFMLKKMDVEMPKCDKIQEKQESIV
ncbi:MAG: carbon starvation protein CstA [Planctomycetes bacterium GWF2_41_51]|nr:MAG: carbon starvation protein CstA [Planctomycetes bacterium GWF2_41_51]HBG26403.1 carbon starvation protein A [Phycisphaerales bacterium]